MTLLRSIIIAFSLKQCSVRWDTYLVNTSLQVADVWKVTNSCAPPDDEIRDVVTQRQATFDPA